MRKNRPEIVLIKYFRLHSYDRSLMLLMLIGSDRHAIVLSSQIPETSVARAQWCTDFRKCEVATPGGEKSNETRAGAGDGE